MAGTIDGGIGIRDFHAALERFGDDVRGTATQTFREAAITTAEAIVVGNAFGPGVPVDTGFLRASWRVAIGEPEDGPSERPRITGRKLEDPPLFADALDTSAVASAELGAWVYITTSVGYAEYLEDGGRYRRFGRYRGEATPFIAPVEQRFNAIVEDAARRVGYGEDGA